MGIKRHNPLNIQELGERAKHRLRISASFLRQEGYRFLSDDFYQEVLNVIAALGSEQRETLRGLVDWVEEYEAAELQTFGEVSSRSARRKRRSSKVR